MRKARESWNRTLFSRKSIDLDDPLARALAPPEGETRRQKKARIHEQRTASKVSREIDRDIVRERKAARKQVYVAILLLGLSESGKSTIAKNLQLKFDPSSFDRERTAWRSVCQLNVVRSVKIILDLMNEVLEEQDRALQPEQHCALQTEQHCAQQITPCTTASSEVQVFDSENNSHPRVAGPAALLPRVLTSEHRQLMARLAPLLKIEQALPRRFKLPFSSTPRRALPLSPPHSQVEELHVNGYAWQQARAREGRHGSVEEDRYHGEGENEEEELGRVLAACQADMVALWADKDVREILKKTRMEEALNEFFLDNLNRIAVPHYVPTDDDVLHARLKTVGVTVHHLTPYPNTPSIEYRIHEVGGVGGSINHREAWAPFFDGADAIFFLAPMSAFDQTLMEAPKSNYLEETLYLWEAICASPLLANTSLVLLLNKRDILERKLASGIQFSRYCQGFKGNNDPESVASYLKTKFTSIQRRYSPRPRLNYTFVTCATETKRLPMILLNFVRESILRDHLISEDLL